MSTVEIRSGETLALIEPDIGFTCYSFVVDGFDHIYTERGFPPAGKPTHSASPILFPWPNRIAGAHFTWQGLDYALPQNEAATGASIHGYAVGAGWTVVDVGSDHVSAEFTVDRHAPWPAAARLRVTYRVAPGRLVAETEVTNPDDVPLPYGLGFHPYLRVPGAFEQWRLQCDATRSWPLAGMIPTGEVVDVPPRLDFRSPRGLGDDHLDDVLTGLPPADALVPRARLQSAGTTLTVSSDPGFREYVLFTPASRKAVAIEPYTCATDAVHLQQRDIDAGWRVLSPGASERLTWRLDVA